MVRILLVSSGAGLRGGERQTLALGAGIAAGGHAVSFAVRSGGDLARIIPGEYPLLRAPFEVLPLLTPLRLRRFIARWRPDLVHAQTSRAHTHALLACIGGPPLIVSRRVAFSGAGAGAGLKYGAGVAHFIPISRAAAASLAARGVPQSKMTLVYSGVDTRLFAAANRDEKLREKLGAEKGVFLVGTAAALEREKGLDVLIRAAALSRAGPSRLRIVIMGRGRLEGRLRALACKLGLAAEVTFAGAEIPLEAFLKAVDIFALPSLQEGLSTGLIAAMAAGLPCVASNSGGIPEVAGTGNMVLVEPGDPVRLAEALARLAADRALRDELGRRARLRAQEFTIEKTVQGTLEVYRAVLAERIEPETGNSTALAKGRGEERKDA